MNTKISPYVFPGCYVEPVLDGNLKEPMENISMSDICYQVCNRTGVPMSEIRGGSRKRVVSDARHIIYYLANRHTPLSHTQILYKLRDTNHHRTTLYAAISKIQNLIESDPTFKDMILKIRKELKRIDINKTLNKAA